MPSSHFLEADDADSADKSTVMAIRFKKSQSQKRKCGWLFGKCKSHFQKSQPHFDEGVPDGSFLIVGETFQSPF